MKFFKYVILLIIVIWNCETLSNPKPLGIVLNETNLEEISKNHEVIASDNYGREIRGYKEYYVSPNKFYIEGLLRIEISVDSKNIIRSIVLFIDKDIYNELYKTLSEKYNIVKKGNSYAKFSEQENTIVLSRYLRGRIKIYVSYQNNEYTSKLNKIENRKINKYNKVL